MKAMTNEIVEIEVLEVDDLDQRGKDITNIFC